MRYIFALITIFFTTTAFADIKFKTLAQVYNVFITDYDLDDRIESLALLNNADVDKFQGYREKIFQDMIKDEVFLHQVKKLKIKITKEEVDDLIEESEEGRGLPKGTIQSLVKKHPSIYKSFEAQVAKNVLIQNLIAPKIVITQEEIEKQKQQPRKVMKFSIAVLHMTKDEISLAKNGLAKMTEIQGCKAFTDLIETNKLPQATIVEGALDDLNDTMKAFVENYPQGKVSEKIQVGDDAYQYFMLCGKQNVAVGTKTEAEIKNEIYNRKLETGINSYYLSLTKNAHIVIFKK